MEIHKATTSQLLEALAAFDSDGWKDVILPVIMSRHDRLVGTLIDRNDEEIRGKIKEIEWFLRMPANVKEEVQSREKQP